MEGYIEGEHGSLPMPQDDLAPLEAAVHMARQLAREYGLEIRLSVSVVAGKRLQPSGIAAMMRFAQEHGWTFTFDDDTGVRATREWAGEIDDRG